LVLVAVILARLRFLSAWVVVVLFVAFLATLGGPLRRRL
jgi:hypothetical protein